MGMNENAVPKRKENLERMHEMEAGQEFFAEAVYGNHRSEDYWRRFLQTGRVADYLNYTASSAEDDCR